MKLLLFITCIIFASCHSIDRNSARSIASTEKYTTIQYLDSSYLDLGKVNEGVLVKVQYAFKNTGDNPLIIENVRSTCGCTIPEWNKTPIMPGQQDTILAMFNSEGRVGLNDKFISVETNTKPKSTTVLRFRIIVVN